MQPELSTFITLLALFILSVTQTLGASGPSVDKDCCQLEWKKIIDKDNERFIPASAISIGKTVLGFDIYYFWNSQSNHFGLINSTTSGMPFCGVSNRVTWQGGSVLSNPNDCVLGWEGKEYIKPIGAINYTFPSHEGREFGKGVLNGTLWFGDFNSDDLALSCNNLDKGLYNSCRESLQFLYVDCFASLRNQVTAQLVDINFDLKALMSQGEQILASTEVTNEGDQDQLVKVDLGAKIVSSLEMLHEGKLARFINTKWGINATPSDSFSFVEDQLNLFAPLLSGKEYNPSEMKNEFAKSGQLELQLMQAVYKFNQEVKTKAKSTSKVVIKRKLVRGHIEYTAHYLIKPRVSLKMWTKERIRDTMERMGFEDLEQMKEAKDGWFIAYKGAISIKTGLQTVALISSQPLGSTVSTTIYEKTLVPTD